MNSSSERGKQVEDDQDKADPLLEEQRTDDATITVGDVSNRFAGGGVHSDAFRR